MSDDLKRFRATVRHEGENIFDTPWLEEFWAVRYEEAADRIEELEATLAALKARDALVLADALRDAVNACANVDQETKPGNASEALIFHLGFTEGRKLCERAISAIHVDASRAIPIKEKDDE